MRLGATIVTATALAAGLAACTTVQNAREQIVRAPPRCLDSILQIYFEPQSADVTDESRAVIAEAAADARACRLTGVEVMGLADAAGAPGANLELSRRRARSVTAALEAAGLPAGDIRLTAAGQAGAVAEGGAAAPLRRRADVILHLAPR
jgi:outer membrane protein OmpA-like peptidoglycan-associated protein